MSDLTINLATENRDVLFSPTQEAQSLGQATHDPYPRLLELMRRGSVQEGALYQLMGMTAGQAVPMIWPEYPAYTLFGFDEVNQAFLDNDAFTSGPVYKTMTEKWIGDTLLNMDGVRHRRNRNVAKPYFKPTFAETWWTDNWIVKAVDQLVSRLETKSRADLNMELCAPLPVSVVSVAFGLPVEHIVPFRIAIHEVSAGHDHAAVTRATATIDRILRDQIALRRKAPRDDLISKLTSASFEDDAGPRPYSDDEIVRYCALIVFAGGGTTWRQLGITIRALLDHPEQLELLRADRSLLRATIQESTRWYPTDPVFPRWIAKDVEVGGVALKAGSVAYLCVATANRDPAVWDRPDEFDIRRPIKRHLAFGAGIHACLGQHVSRREMEVALETLLDRLPRLRWDEAAQPSHMSGGTLLGRGPETLNVRYD